LRIRGLRPDVLHFEDVNGRSSPLLFLMRRPRKLVAVHDARTHLGERVGRAETIRRVATRQADHLLFYSRFSQGQFGASATPSSVLPLGPKLVWSEQPGPSRSPRDLSVLFFGRLSAYKGLDVLYAALPAVADRVPDVRVVVAGRPGPGFVA